MRINSKFGLSRAAVVLSVVLPFLAMAPVFAQGPTGAHPTGANPSAGEQLAGNAPSPETGVPAPAHRREPHRRRDPLRRAAAIGRQRRVSRDGRSRTGRDR